MVLIVGWPFESKREKESAGKRERERERAWVREKLRRAERGRLRVVGAVAGGRADREVEDKAAIKRDREQRRRERGRKQISQPCVRPMV